MSDRPESEAADSSPSANMSDLSHTGVHQFLVRLLPSGTVCWVGSVHQHRDPQTGQPLRRGARVVVQNVHGDWLAEVLRVASAAEQSAGTASGELLRFAHEEDEQAAVRSRETAKRLFAETGRDRIAADVTIVSTEVSLDRRIGVVRMLGTADERFGPAAVRLAGAVELQRVQWIDISANASAQDRLPDGPSEKQSVWECTPEQAADAAFWQRMQQVVDDGVPLGASYRVAAGNRGFYQQKLREPKRATGKPDVSAGSSATRRRWMLRVRTVAGGITARQLVQLARIARKFGDGTLRLTTRQAIQLHGVPLNNAPEAMQQLQAAILRTAGSCGNTFRNLTCCPLPAGTSGERQLRALAARLARECLPVGPIFECNPQWLHADAAAGQPVIAGDRVASPATGEDTLHSSRADSIAASMLPHKWKVGLAFTGHNCVDVLNNDLAIVLRRREDGNFAGRSLADLFIGGSTAYQPGRDGSHPRLARWLGATSTERIAPVLWGLTDLFCRRVLGEQRHFRRWKYVVDRLGVETIREELRAALPTGVDWSIDAGPPPLQSLRLIDHARETVQPDGRIAFCVPIAGGRLPCVDAVVRSLDRFAELGITVRVAPGHALVFADVGQRVLSETRDMIETIERAAAFPLPGSGNDAITPGVDAAGGTLFTSPAIACPAFPTCPLAVDEAQRVLGTWWQVVHEVAAAQQIATPRFALSGCGNGCSRPLTSEIGVVAEQRGKRRVFLGGDGVRLGKSIGTVASPSELRDLLTTWLSRYAATRQADESLSDWFCRQHGETAR